MEHTLKAFDVKTAYVVLFLLVLLARQTDTDTDTDIVTDTDAFPGQGCDVSSEGSRVSACGS